MNYEGRLLSKNNRRVIDDESLKEMENMMKQIWILKGYKDYQV
jgi:hypothetical protein